MLDGGWTNYPLGNVYVQYNPDPACGGSTINIRSRATSALYRYTPYQPNAGALANHPGTAPCGAYGNRNFYSFFTDWFGSTQNSQPPAPNPSEPVPSLPDTAAVTNLSGSYTIVSAFKPRQSLDIAGGNFNNGTNIQLFSANGTKAQEWKINRVGV